MEEIVISMKYKEFNLEISSYIHKNGDDLILCLHGLQSNKEMFKSLPSDFSLLAIDFIGFGKSSKPQEFSYDLLDQAKICKEIVASLNLKNIHIIGHSMGGMIGTLLLDMIPEKIASFINMEGNLVLEDCTTSKEVAILSFEEFQKFYQELKNKLKKSNEPSVPYREKWLNLIPDYAFYKSSLSIVKWSNKLLPIFQNFKNKLFMHGEKKYPYTPSVKISNADHFMMIDNPEECIKQITKFIQNV